MTKNKASDRWQVQVVEGPTQGDVASIATRNLKGQGVLIPEVRCAECRMLILTDPPSKAPKPPVLCQKCDPAWASLADNKHHIA